MAVSVSSNVSMNISPHSVPAARGCKYTGQSVRAVPIRILTVGKNRSVGVQLIVDEYIGKLKNYCSIDDVQIRSNPKNARDVMAQIEQEDAAVMKIVKPGDWVVMLDENGLGVRSEQMAELIGDAGNTGMDYPEGTKVPPLDTSCLLLWPATAHERRDPSLDVQDMRNSGMRMEFWFLARLQTFTLLIGNDSCNSCNSITPLLNDPPKSKDALTHMVFHMG